MNMKFRDYFEYIYLNTFLNKDEALNAARECWNKGMSKEEALGYIRQNEEVLR